MPNAPVQRLVLAYGTHPMFRLSFDDLDALIVERGETGGRGWYIIEVPGHGYVACFYLDPHDGDSVSVDGYFESLEAAKDYLTVHHGA